MIKKLIISVTIFLFSLSAYSIDLSFMGIAGLIIRGAQVARDADNCSSVEEHKIQRFKSGNLTERDWLEMFPDPNVKRKFAKQIEKERLEIESQKEDFSFLDKYKPMLEEKTKDKLSIKVLDLYERWLRWEEQQKKNVDYGYVLKQMLRENESETEKLERLKSEIEDLRRNLGNDLEDKLRQFNRDMESQRILQRSEMFNSYLEMQSRIRSDMMFDVMFRRSFPNYRPYNFWLYLALLRYF